MSYERQKLVQVSRMYYEQGKTQNEISKILDLSRVQVTRMLAAAKKRGVVQIYIMDEQSPGSILSMEKEIEIRFNLKKAIIVPSSSTQEYDPISKIAHTGAQYISSILQSGQIVGVGWGMAVTAMANCIYSNQRKDVLFVPALGGINEKEQIYNVSDILKLLSEKIGGMFSPLHAPALVDDKNLRDALLNDSSVMDVCRLWSQLDALIVGIGGLRNKMPIVLRDYILRNEFSIKKLNIAADICFNFLNESGELVRSNLDERSINIKFDDIKRTPMTIAIAGGKSKVYAIHAALLSGCLDVLISDEKTCRDLLGLTVMH